MIAVYVMKLAWMSSRGKNWPSPSQNGRAVAGTLFLSLLALQSY